MNTSLFVGLCEGAGLEVDFGNEVTYVYTGGGVLIATVSESIYSLYRIDTYEATRDEAIKASEIVVPYALTPIEERE